jgi:hypothetical protein
VSGDARISRQELAAVAVALLLPIPLLVASGLRFPLSGAIERGAASLTPGGGFDAAVVEAAPARTDTTPAVPSPVVSGEGVSAVTPRMSSVVLPPSADASPAASGTPDVTTPAEEDSPSLPEPHTDDETPSGEDDGDSGGGTGIDLSEAPAAVAAKSIVEIEAEAADASVQVTVTDGGVAVDTGGAADVGPPLELSVEPPVTPPTLPLP